MKPQTNRQCYFCGKPYFACDSSLKLGSWKSSCCSPEHFQAWQIVLAVQSGAMTPNDALKALNRINVRSSSASDVVGAKSILDAAFAKQEDPEEAQVEVMGSIVEDPKPKRKYTKKTQTDEMIEDE